MAGGIGPGRSRSLAARTASSSAGDGGRLDRLRRRHCWVLGPPNDPGPWPGVVAEWRRDGEGWQARVVFVLGETTSTAEQWVPAGRVRPGWWPDGAGRAH